jgi:hypothetical protein
VSAVSGSAKDAIGQETCGEDRDHAKNSRSDVRESEGCERDSTEAGRRIGTANDCGKFATCLPLSFDEDGCVQDGSHTLHAIVQSGKTHAFVCEVGS